MVKKNQLIISIVGTILLLLLCSAKGLGQGKENYRQAYTRLVRMLEGKDSLDFKKAVFLTENAYFDNSLNYDAYNDQITALATICRRVGDQPKFKDVANNVQYNWAVHQFITDTLDFTLEGDTIRKLPYRYDTLDPSGQNDIINTFLLKLLQTGTGNCRSLTYFYKILADELGAESFFTLAPYHIYIQHFDPPNRYHEKRSYNLELTNGSFPRDGWIIASSYITWTAIRNGMYGVRLNEKQNIALCLSDLGVSYERKFGTDDFLIKLYQTARKYHPENAQNRVRLAESYRKVGKVSSADSLCATLVLEGYREMPDRMYDLWRTEVRKDKDALHSDTSRTYEAPKDPFGNPMPTLSKGKFKEDADQTDSTRVGSVVVNCQTGKVMRYCQEARVYDVSRFLSVDPLINEYPYLTPYQFAENTPIWAIDIDGLEGGTATIPDKIIQHSTAPNQIPKVFEKAPGIGTVVKAINITLRLEHEQLPKGLARLNERIKAEKAGTLLPEKASVKISLLGHEQTIVYTVSEQDAGKVAKIPDLDGKTLEEAEEALTNEGFPEASISQPTIANPDGGGNRTYKHPDGSIVTIKREGQVIRGSKPRYETPNNPKTPRINKGERMYKDKDGNWNLSRDRDLNHADNETIKMPPPTK